MLALDAAERHLQANSWNTLPEYFIKHGYTALGLGKTFHGCSTEIVPCPLPANPQAGPCVYPSYNTSLSAMGYCDLRSWSTDVLPYLPFKLEHCPGNVQMHNCVPDRVPQSRFIVGSLRLSRLICWCWKFWLFTADNPKDPSSLCARAHARICVYGTLTHTSGDDVVYNWRYPNISNNKPNINIKETLSIAELTMKHKYLIII